MPLPLQLCGPRGRPVQVLLLRRDEDDLVRRALAQPDGVARPVEEAAVGRGQRHGPRVVVPRDLRARPVQPQGQRDRHDPERVRQEDERREELEAAAAVLVVVREDVVPGEKLTK